MDLFNSIISLFYPDRCPYCNRVIPHKDIACEKCRQDFPDYIFKRYAKGGYYCYSPFAYSDNFKSAVKRFKFRNHPEYSKKLVYPMADILKENVTDVDFDFVSYVPMHRKKLNTRGYNQAQLLAKDLGKVLNLPCEDTLVKIKENKEQHTCKKEDRYKNVKGVYKATKSENIKGKTILLVDDIVTTGNTLGECCRILKKSGAKEIYCVTVCATN